MTTALLVTLAIVWLVGVGAYLRRRHQRIVYDHKFNAYRRYNASLDKKDKAS